MPDSLLRTQALNGLTDLRMIEDYSRYSKPLTSITNVNIEIVHTIVLK